MGYQNKSVSLSLLIQHSRLVLSDVTIADEDTFHLCNILAINNTFDEYYISHSITSSIMVSIVFVNSLHI